MGVKGSNTQSSSESEGVAKSRRRALSQKAAGQELKGLVLREGVWLSPRHSEEGGTG